MADPIPKKFKAHVFVCTNEREAGHRRGCCAHRGSNEILSELKKAAIRGGLAGEVRVQRAGCLDTCERGPSLVVYPDDVWYQNVKLEDIEDIVNEHLVGGRPVERLMIPEKR